MIPRTIFWEITDRCNLRCKHCYLGDKEKKFNYQFSKRQVLNYVDLLYKNGIETILFMGGEPLLYPHIYEAIERVGKFGHKLHAGVLTNGILLSNRVAVKLKKSGVSAVQVSLDGVSSIYKKIRGVDFQIINENIKGLQKNKIPLRAKFTLNKINLDEFEDVWNYCHENKIRLSTSLILEVGRAGKNLIPTPDEYFTWFVNIFKIREISRPQKTFSLPDFSIEDYLHNGNPKIGCDAGRGVVGITKDNKFVPCIYLSGIDTKKLFGIDPPEFNNDFQETFEKHPLFTLFRKEASESFGCPIRKKLYGGKDPFSVYEFIKRLKLAIS